MRLFVYFIFLNCELLAQDKPSKTGFFQKLSKADTVKGWFRFEKNAHVVTAAPWIESFISGNSKSRSKNALFLKYEFFPIKRLGVGILLIPSYNYSQKYNDDWSVQYTLSTSYYFFGKNKLFIAPTIDISSANTWGISNLSPLPNYEGVLGDGKKFNIQRNYLSFGVIGGLYIFNNMSFQIQASRAYSISKASFGYKTFYGGFTFSYYFRKNQLPHSKKPIKDWFKSDRPKRTHAERKAEEQKRKAGL